MLLKQMKYFITVVDLHSFTEAAEQCFISQSAISQQIKALEKELGVRLFERSKRQFSLTVAGEFFYRHGKVLLDEIEDFKEETWLSFLDQVPIAVHDGDYIFDQSDAKRNLRSLQKRYGTMKKNVRLFESELYTIESFLMVLYASFQISSRDAQRIIHVVMNRLLDIENQETTDYSEYTHEDILYMADGLEQICNPFVNEELEKFLRPYVNIHDLQCYDYLFKNVFLCMSKVLDSIDFWDKEFGKDGYFRYIRQFMNVNHIMNDGPQFFFNENTLSKDIK